MIKDIQQLEANYDGLPLEVMTIAPDTDVRAVMVIHHGMCEHKERYIWFMKQMSGQGHRLCDRGYAWPRCQCPERKRQRLF